MRRSASEIIRNLETRVARLESSSNPRQAKDAYDIWRRKVDQYIIKEMRVTFEYETKDGETYAELTIRAENTNIPAMEPNVPGAGNLQPRAPRVDKDLIKKSIIHFPR